MCAISLIMFVLFIAICMHVRLYIINYIVFIPSVFRHRWFQSINQSINQSWFFDWPISKSSLLLWPLENANYRRMSGNERRNRKVFRWCWNDCRVDALTMYSGSEFQMEEAACWKSSAADSGEFDRRHDETIGGGWTEVPSTRNVGDACERSQVSRRATVKNSVTQHGDLVLYALRYPQPMKANERISDVIGALQVEDQPCRRVQHRLTTSFVRSLCNIGSKTVKENTNTKQ